MSEPPAETVTAEVEFHITDGKVTLAIIKSTTTLQKGHALAIAEWAKPGKQLA